jgi:RNA polymerase sigma-70 factor (ECF subfamily)
VNGVRDFHRRRKFLGLFNISTEENDPECEQPDIGVNDEPAALDALLKREFWGQAERVAERLSRWEREVFFLRFLDELSITEIAETLHKSESTIKTLLYRGIKKFRDEGSFLHMLREK